nr:MAG TPA: hypothetical protein [Caudoviricetes sp.]
MRYAISKFILSHVSDIVNSTVQFLLLLSLIAFALCKYL